MMPGFAWGLKDVRNARRLAPCAKALLPSLANGDDDVVEV